ncbi:MAG: hypothetical protein WCF94_03485 [bacterium]
MKNKLFFLTAIALVAFVVFTGSSFKILSISKVNAGTNIIGCDLDLNHNIPRSLLRASER